MILHDSHGVSYHQQLDCLISIFMPTTKKSSKLHISWDEYSFRHNWPLWGTTPVIGGFSSQRGKLLHVMMASERDHFVNAPGQGRRRYIVTSSLIGWAHSQNDPRSWSVRPCLSVLAAVRWADSRPDSCWLAAQVRLPRLISSIVTCTIWCPPDLRMWEDCSQTGQHSI